MVAELIYNWNELNVKNTGLHDNDVFAGPEPKLIIL